MKVLVTCPPMIGIKPNLGDEFKRVGIEPHFADVVQTLTEAELIGLVPEFDGWIIGDDPATRKVFSAGKQGRLKAAVKWGVGVDNVDFEACKDLGIPVTNTPAMFGQEVADIAIGYLIGLARHTFRIDREVRAGGWPKYRGVSLSGKTVGLVGCGDIGFQILRRLDVLGCEVIVYDPYVDPEKISGFNARRMEFSKGIEECDFIVLACALTPENRHMLNDGVLSACKRGVRVINVSRGPLIEQRALVAHLESGQVAGAALDVFETEPLDDKQLRSFENCIFGSHNGSNTEEAVFRTSIIAIEKLCGGLGLG